MKNRTTAFAQEEKAAEKVAIDCAVRHISALFHQCAEHREADFGEPCSQCQYAPTCKFDFLNSLKPLFQRTTEEFTIAVKKEPNDNPETGGDGRIRLDGLQRKADKKHRRMRDQQ